MKHITTRTMNNAGYLPPDVSESEMRRREYLAESLEQDIAEAEYEVLSSLRRLEKLVGREATKDFLKNKPLAF